MLAIWAAAETSSSTATALIQTIGTVVAAAIAAVGAVYGVRAHREARSAKVEARGAHVNAYAANHAVNNVGPGVPTLVQRVGSLEQHTQWQSNAVQTIAENIGVDLPPQPPQPAPPVSTPGG